MKPARRLLVLESAAVLLLSAAALAQLPKPAPDDKDAPSLFPVPDSLEKISEAFRPGVAGTTKRDGKQNDPKTALLEAAEALRAKAKLFRAGKCTKTDLQAAAAEVDRAAVAYRAALAMPKPEAQNSKLKKSAKLQ